jgi:hypothetical protein
MPPDQMLSRASHVFVGVIQKQQFESWPLFRLHNGTDDPAYWKILRREIRVELVLRGSEPRNVVNVYEIFWTGGASGNWNSTQNGERDLFLVRVENGRYHVVRDWLRSIFPVTSGLHSRLPLDESHPLWERIALMNWRVEQDGAARIAHPEFTYNDPGRVLTLWRTVKLERGLVRHPSAGVRVAACKALLWLTGWGQDECWDALSNQDRLQLPFSAADVAKARSEFDNRTAEWWWSRLGDREERRLLTAANNCRLRTEFCRLFEREYIGDQDNGCPADQPPPATIVTDGGDVPLSGPWPD